MDDIAGMSAADFPGPRSQEFGQARCEYTVQPGDIELRYRYGGKGLIAETPRARSYSDGECIASCEKFCQGYPVRLQLLHADQDHHISALYRSAKSTSMHIEHLGCWHVVKSSK